MKTALQKPLWTIFLMLMQLSSAGAAVEPTFSDANWVSMNPTIPGTSDQVNATAVDDSGNLYIGGWFTAAGEIPANRIAKWNGTNWSALGSGIGGSDYPVVLALAVSGSNVYVGGGFTNAGGIAANNIAKWDGTRWSALGAGLNDRVDALAVSGDDLYAATESAGWMGYLSKWDGANWSTLGQFNDYPDALVVSGSNLYVGGNFTAVDGKPANRIAKWDGSSWSALGSGIPSDGGFTGVYALAVSGSDVYAAGNFTSAGGSPANYIAKWDGANWSPLASGIGGGVEPGAFALAVSDGNLYAGGDFSTAGGLSANNAAKWDGAAWSPLDVGTDFRVWALAISGTNVYVGGGFSTAGGITAENIAKWGGSHWSALGSGTGVPGPRGSWFGLAASGNNVYASGSIVGSGDVGSSDIAKWTGTNWLALGLRTAGPGGYYVGAYGLTAWGSNLYVGGSFTNVNGITANNIAKWDGTNWSALGTGVNGDLVDLLAVSGNDLYVAGRFTTAGGSPANNIARWDGTDWAALGSGIVGSNSYLRAIAVLGSDLYVGGQFSTAGGIPANNIAKWDGSSWSALGSGVTGDRDDNYGAVVLALAVSGNDLYVGGTLTNAGGIVANHIAKWDGTNWWALGSGVGDILSSSTAVLALTVSGGDLYVGGDFWTASGIVANHIAKWDGSNWWALGSGADGVVGGFAVAGNILYVGGDFGTAGGKVSPFLARAYLKLPTLSFLRAGGSVTLSWPTSLGEFVLQENLNVANVDAWSYSAYQVSTNSALKTATIPITAGNQFFRLIGH